jgi:hypothetical protein
MSSGTTNPLLFSDGKPIGLLEEDCTTGIDYNNDNAQWQLQKLADWLSQLPQAPQTPPAVAIENDKATAKDVAISMQENLLTAKVEGDIGTGIAEFTHWATLPLKSVVFESTDLIDIQFLPLRLTVYCLNVDSLTLEWGYHCRTLLCVQSCKHLELSIVECQQFSPPTKHSAKSTQSVTTGTETEPQNGLGRSVVPNAKPLTFRLTRVNESEKQNGNAIALTVIWNFGSGGPSMPNSVTKSSLLCHVLTEQM